MTAAMTLDEKRRLMQNMGIPREKIDATLRGEMPTVTSGYLQVVGPELRFPVRLTLPWSALCSDNRKYAASMQRYRGGSTGARIVMTPTYRAAKQKAHGIALDAMLVETTQFSPFAMPLRLVARVWVPDNRPGHDVVNFAKCAHDAMQGAVYTVDEWLHDARWIRAGVDVDHPRAELEIAPL